MRFLCCLIFLFSFAYVQSFPPLEGVVATDSSRLNVEAINEAAKELLDKNVQPFVLFIEGDIGASLDDAETYRDIALERYGFASGGDIDNDLFALFIGTNPLERSGGERPLYVVYGDNLKALSFQDTGSGTFDDVLRFGVIAPQLVEGEFTQAVTRAFEQVSAGLSPSAVAVPPTLPDPAPRTQEREPSLALQFGRFVLLAFGVLALMLVVSRLRKREGAGREDKQEASHKLTQIKSELSNTLIDLSGSEARTGHDPYLPERPEDQTDMALLTGLLAEERPEELSQLKEDYRAASTQLRTINERFSELSALEAKETRTASTLESYVPHYEDLLTQAQELVAFSQSLSNKWQTLQSEIASLDTTAMNLGSQLERSKERYDELKQASWPDGERVFLESDTSLGEVQHLKDSQPLTALRVSQELKTNLDTVDSAVERLSQLETQLAEFDTRLATLRAGGYQLADRDKAQKEVWHHLEVALGLLKQGEYKVLDAQVDEVSELTEALISDTEETVKRHKRNNERLSELEAEGDVIKALIEEGVKTFEAIENYAPSNWRDIRGNGTEAQKAADYAYELYLDAKEENSLEGAQAFEDAEDKLIEAEAELMRARDLIDAIKVRLEHLRRAQATAESQLALVQKDVSAQLEVLADPNVDRQVSERPEQMLSEAAELLQRAKDKLNEEDTDWLTIMKDVQEADRLVDEALEATRTELEAMEHRRVRLSSEKTEASAALSRMTEYVRIHRSDMGANALQALQESQTAFSEGERLEALSLSQEDSALAESLDAAARHYDAAEQLANSAFEQAEKDFADMEVLRKEAAEVLASTSANLENLERFIARSNLSSMQQTLYSLSSALPAYRPDANREDLEGAIARAKALDAEIHGVYAEARQQVEQLESARRQARLQQLEEARRRRAVESARRNSSWGTWSRPSAPPVVYRPSSRSRRPSYSSRRSSSSRTMPRARSAPPVRLPSSRSRRGSGRSTGGGWGGKGRKTGGGW